MIKISKLAKPDVLEKNEAKWTLNLISKQATGQKITDADKSHYRHEQIKNRLIEETGGKCAYCESKLLHIAYGDVEHIHPKKNDLSLSFKWENLTLACDVCNTKKGTNENIIDPYTNEPRDHFYICGPLILAFSADEIAYNTQVVLDLNRGDLVEKRQKRIEYLQSLCIVLSRINNPAIKESLKADYLLNETKNETEYAALSRWFFDDAASRNEI